MEEIKDDELDEIIKAKEEFENLTEEQKYRIQKEAQAKVVIDEIKENPKALINTNISQRTLNLINDDEFEEELNEVARGNVKRVIDENKGQNRKDDNSNFYLGREDSIKSLGGDESTPVHRQVTIHIIYTIWWYLFMASFGLFLVAPLKVLLNWAHSLSPEITVSRQHKGEVITEKIKKLHWLPAIFCLLFYSLYVFLFIKLLLVIFL